MKKHHFKILALFILLTGIIPFMGCENNSSDPVSDKSAPSLIGTWSGIVDSDGTFVKIIFTETQFIETINGAPAFDGTYVITGTDVMTIRYTHAMNENWEYVVSTDSEDYSFDVTETSLSLYDGNSGEKLYTLTRQ